MGMRERLEWLRRDVAWLGARLANRRPPPFALCGPALPAPTATATDGLLGARVLRIVEVVRETEDSVALVLEDPSGAPIRARAGQFLTLLVEIDGVTLRRAYSIASAAGAQRRVLLGVKRVAGGRVSTHIVERARAGDRVLALGPSGSFGPRPASAPRRLVLVGGGSGITPLLGIARTILAEEPAARVGLLYANRRADAVLFAAALAGLEAAHPDRFVVRHVFGPVLDRGAAARALAELGAGAESDVFLCGPSPMAVEARAALAGLGVPAERVHEERFTRAPTPADGPRARAGGPARVTFRVAGRAHAVDVAPGATLLEAGLAAGVALPFSCAFGGCGACKVRVVEGEVDVDEPSCLSAAERAAGAALTCVGRARPGGVVVEVPSS